MTVGFAAFSFGFAVLVRAPNLERLNHEPRIFSSRLTSVRLLVVAQAEIHRVPQLAVGGPLGELDLRDELGLTQCGVSFVFGCLERATACVSSGFSSFITRASSRSLKPVPVWPTVARASLSSS